MPKPKGKSHQPEPGDLGELPSPFVPTEPARAQKTSEDFLESKGIRHVAASDFLSKLNQTVGLIHSLFQDRDHLVHEIEALKTELGVGKEVRLDKQMLLNFQREREAFLYQWDKEKTRNQQEREEGQKAYDALLKKKEEEQKTRMSREIEEHNARLKREEEDHGRRLKVEMEDFERAKKLLLEEKAALGREQELFKKEREDIQKRLTTELDIGNRHARELADLNHQREMAILKGELELERAAKAKLEASLKDAYVQIDRLSAQLATLSREALTSVSSSAMANRLEDIVTQIAGSSKKGKENN